jgi:glycerophosphoryl diester phosphodiesterase
MRRVGHKGADLIAPGNTVESFDAAVAAGVDMIEFDVLPEDPSDPASSPLRLAHDHSHDLTQAPTLDAGLAHLAKLDLDLVCDLKLPGYEARVVEALRAHGLVGRGFVSSLYMRSLVVLRELEPGLKLGWSVPRVSRDYTQSLVYAVPAYAALQRVKRRLPSRAAGHIRAGRCDALMAHWRLVNPALVEAIHAAGGELFVWTVDDADKIRQLEALGVDGVISNDPRLFIPPQEMRQVSAV